MQKGLQELTLTQIIEMCVTYICNKKICITEIIFHFLKQRTIRKDFDIPSVRTFTILSFFTTSYLQILMT